MLLQSRPGIHGLGELGGRQSGRERRSKISHDRTSFDLTSAEWASDGDKGSHWQRTGPGVPLISARRRLGIGGGTGQRAGTDARIPRQCRLPIHGCRGEATMCRVRERLAVTELAAVAAPTPLPLLARGSAARRVSHREAASGGLRLLWCYCGSVADPACIKSSTMMVSNAPLHWWLPPPAALLCNAGRAPSNSLHKTRLFLFCFVRQKNKIKNIKNIR